MQSDFKDVVVKGQAKLYTKTFKEITLYDQYGEEFEPMRKQLNMTSSICGYVAAGNGQFAANELRQIASEKLLDKVPEIFQKLRAQRLEICLQVAQFIQQSRRDYIKRFSHNFKNDGERKSYLTDWVATYEISDYFTLLQDDNIVFWRNVAYDHPQEMEKMKNEELTRVVEEERFKGQGYFIDYKGTLMSLDEFKEGHWNKLGQAEKNKFAFVLDLLGHFVCVIIIGNEGFLMDTTHNNYLDTQSFKDFVRFISN